MGARAHEGELEERGFDGCGEHVGLCGARRAQVWWERLERCHELTFECGLGLHMVGGRLVRGCGGERRGTHSVDLLDELEDVCAVRVEGGVLLG